MPIGGRLDAVGHLDRRGPTTLCVARDPNADIRVTFVGAAKPGRDQAALAFDDRRRMTLGERSRFVDELGLHQTGWLVSVALGSGGSVATGHEAKCKAADGQAQELFSDSRVHC